MSIGNTERYIESRVDFRNYNSYVLSYADCTMVAQSLKLLRDAAAMLRNKVSLHFKEATSVNDTASVQRFFKLFPLLNMHDYGLEQFFTFLRKTLKNTVNEKLSAIRGISVKERRNVTIFADIITFLFEEIAKIVTECKPLVETYYGTRSHCLCYCLLRKILVRNLF